jgi:hypothetical protein
MAAGEIIRPHDHAPGNDVGRAMGTPKGFPCCNDPGGPAEGMIRQSSSDCLLREIPTRENRRQKGGMKTARH